jgi:uncharacterized ferredoxin-like protein
MRLTFNQTTKLSVFLLLAAVSHEGMAEFNKPSGLSNRGQTKVHGALAKSYLQKGATSVQQSRTVVNIGSKRAGTCTMNIGTTNDKKAKDVIVTAKDIINVCR